MTTTPAVSFASFLGADPHADRLYDNVGVQVPGVTLPIMKMQTWNAIEEFYLRSTSRRELVNWQLAIGVNSIDFNPFDETWLVAWVLHVCGLYKFKINPPGELVDLYPASAVRTGTALLALKPNSFMCTCLPDELWQQWFETILAGVLYRLYAMPAKPWSAPQLATVYLAKYRAGIGRARAVAQQQFTDGPGRWSFPAFASGRRKN